REHTDRDRSRGAEPVILQNDAGARLSRVVRAAGNGPDFAPLHAPYLFGDRVDEGLIRRSLRALRYGDRLPPRLSREAARAHIRPPELNGPQALRSQAVAMRLHLFPRTLRFRLASHWLHVTRRDRDVKLSASARRTARSSSAPWRRTHQAPSRF